MVSRQLQRWEWGTELGLKEPASPNSLWASQNQVGAPRSGLQDGNTQISLVLPREVRGRRRKHTLPTCCVYSRAIPPKIRFCLKPEECQCAPGAAANGGRGGEAKLPVPPHSTRTQGRSWDASNPNSCSVSPGSEKPDQAIEKESSCLSLGWDCVCICFSCNLSFPAFQLKAWPYVLLNKPFEKSFILSSSLVCAAGKMDGRE